MDRCRHGQKGREMENTFEFKFYPHDFNIFGYFYIGAYYDLGDDTLYIDEFLQSAPVWSCGCRR